jgi:hypothetical protein
MRVRPPLIGALFYGLLALPILLSPLPPLTDYVNPVARIHILATLGENSARRLPPAWIALSFSP